MSAPSHANLFGFYILIPIIEMLGALLVVGYVLHALWVIVCRRDDTAARLLIAEGAIAGLSLKLAATLLKTILLSTWQQIGMFVAILALRTLLKKLFTWERGKLLASQKRATPNGNVHTATASARLPGL